jgi:hypothetical protein
VGGKGAFRRLKRAQILRAADSGSTDDELRETLPSGPRQFTGRTLGQRFVRGRLLRLIGDKAHDSNKLDAALRKQGIDMIASHNPTHKKTQDGRKLRRYRHDG